MWKHHLIHLLCLWDVQPTLNGANNQPFQVLVTDVAGNITWINQSALPGASGNVTSLVPQNGILINGSPTVPSSIPIVSVGLNGWTIDDLTKTLKPITSTVGNLGDSTHVISNEYLENLVLCNSSTPSQTHTIRTNSAANYTWITPATAAPPITSLIQVAFGGQMSYSTPTSSTQVMISSVGSAPTWIEQSHFAGMNNLASPPLNVNQGIVIHDVSLLANCLQTLMPGAPGTSLTVNMSSQITWAPVGNVITTNNNSANQVLVTNAGNVIIWENQCAFNGLNNQTASVGFAIPAAGAAYGVVTNNGATSSCLNTVSPGASSVLAANKVFATDNSGNMTWLSQNTLPSPNLFRASILARVGSTVGTGSNPILSAITFTETVLTTSGVPGFTIQQASSSPPNNFTYWWIQSSDGSSGTITVKMNLFINATSSASSTVNRARIYLGSDPGNGSSLGLIHPGYTNNPSAFINNAWMGFLFEAPIILNYHGVEPASYYCMVFQTDTTCFYTLGSLLNFNPLTDLAYEMFLSQII